MELRLYNSLTKQEETFVPLDPAGRRVTFYSCGPTVYDYAHIGNFRSFLNADVLRRTLELLGYEVRQVMNITDVGHMTDDDLADGSGEDKMQQAANRLKEAKHSGQLPENAGGIDPSDPYAIADFYADAFIDDARTLGMRIIADVDGDDDPDAEQKRMPRPTQYITPMIELVERLMAKGHAYLAGDGVVYFDVGSFPDYGQLSGNTPDRIRSGEGGRVDEATQAVKKHPADFMLWKPDPTHIMRWSSPWGEGYPGWHLECSVMAVTLLGEETGGMIDLHSGGEDNIFPHHECEIAQACAASDQAHFARYWFHTRFLLVDGGKMSKRDGTFFTVRDLLAQGHSPAAIRLELIKSHYRGQSNFKKQGLTDSQRQIDRWARIEAWLETAETAPGEGPLAAALPRFKESLAADLNISGAIGVLNEAIGQCAGEGPAPAGELDALRAMDSVLGVLTLDRAGAADTGDLDVERIESLIVDRNEARARQDWAAADHARDELAAMGIEVKDGPEGTTWKKAIAAS